MQITHQSNLPQYLWILANFAEYFKSSLYILEYLWNQNKIDLTYNSVAQMQLYALLKVFILKPNITNSLLQKFIEVVKKDDSINTVYKQKVAIYLRYLKTDPKYLKEIIVYNLQEIEIDSSNNLENNI